MNAGAPRKTSSIESSAYKKQRLMAPILQKSGVFRGAQEGMMGEEGCAGVNRPESYRLYLLSGRYQTVITLLALQHLESNLESGIGLY